MSDKCDVCREVYFAAMEWQQGYDNPDYSVREIGALQRELLELCRKETKKLYDAAMKQLDEEVDRG